MKNGPVLFNHEGREDEITAMLSDFTFPFFASFVSFAVDFLVRVFNH
jgi:hypothetical protein